MKFVVGWFLWIGLFWGCGEKHAGSVSETTNGALAGRVVDSAGNPVMAARAFLFPYHADPFTRSAIEVSVDSGGFFVFDSVVPGVYNVLVRDSVSGLSAWRDSVFIRSGDRSELENVLSLRASAEVRVLWSRFKPAIGERLYIPGTDIWGVVNAADLDSARTTLRGVPQGAYSRLNWVRSGDSSGFNIAGEGYWVGMDGADVVPDPRTRFAEAWGYASGVSGGAGGDTVVVEHYDSLKLILRDSLPRVIWVRGTLNGTEMVRVGSNKSVLGMGASAQIRGFGFILNNSRNVVIRNLSFSGGETDAISVEESSDLVWIDHNYFSGYGDGLIDIKRGSDRVTISWNRFEDQKWVSLIGHSDENAVQDQGKLRTTLHHNWFARTTAYNPRVRYGHVHIWNNWYAEIAEYAIGAGEGAQILLEANAFSDVREFVRRISGNSAVESRLNFPERVNGHQGGAVIDPVYGYHPDYAEEVPAVVRWGTGPGILWSE